MLTIDQIRAARALLDWSQQDLAEHADLSQTGIARIENGTNKPNSKTIAKIEAAFDRANIEFIGTSGLRKRTGEIRTYEGQQGFVDFLIDAYERLKTSENKNVVVNNVDEHDFMKWEGDYCEIHQARMEELQAHYKIIVREGDTNFTASDYAEYRWLSSEFFNDISYYVYADVAALINFTENNVRVFAIHSLDIANFYRKEFDNVWEKTTTPHKNN
ncbi:MAG: transcriptional regulator [Micavibrio sp.]|nr:transcriptional regulator [Micavibrio sp.]|tara:strand:+ start:377 stop:1024 length:648 start_codon:yes stop_codon:yes gene_type:complete